MNKAMIFDIQRSSFVDGDGVRTAVFFKGCNLRCKWCHNPEGLRHEPQLLIYKDKCTECGICTKVCQTGENECTLCGKCALYCPSNARELCGKEYTVQEVLNELLRDKSFYDASGGGVTLSGGECLLQLDFACELLHACKENKIHTAVDTAGNVPRESLERVLPYTDTFLYDIKCITPELHKSGTGVTNEQIIANLKYLSAIGADIIIRVPVIGGFNDTVEEMSKIATLVAEIKPRRCELLPYHALGAHKCSATNTPFCDFSVPSEERMAELRALFDTRK